MARREPAPRASPVPGNGIPARVPFGHGISSPRSYNEGMKRARSSLVLLAIAVLVAAVPGTAVDAAKMYKWVDENGVTHFSTRKPPGQKTDKTKLQGGNLNAPRESTESKDLARIKRKDLTGTGWKDCDSSLCQLTQQLDPGCETSYCSRARHYSENCSSAACVTKRLAFKREVEDKLALKEQLREQQAINANTTPTPPATSQD